MHLQELFDVSSVVPSVYETGMGTAADFDIGDHSYTAEVRRVPEGMLSRLEGTFNVDLPPDAVIHDVAFTINDPERESHAATGLGDEFKVFSVVMSFLRDMKTKYGIEYFLMASDPREESRTRLYKRMAKRFGKQTWTDHQPGFDAYLVRV